MSRSYSEYSTDELLDLLEMAGRHPDLDLIEECLSRPDELTPALLTMLKEPVPSEDWLGKDPRWFRRVHAGKLLLAFGEQEALPLFLDLMRDPERQTLVEWFDTDLHVFGPSAVPAFVELMRDPSAPPFGRHYAIGTLQQIAQDHPEEAREQVLEALRGELPPVSSEGEVQLARDASPEEVSHEEIEHWTFVVLSLAELHDDESRDQVEALYEADLIDEMIIGGLEDYHEIRTGKWAPQDFGFDLLEEYARRQEREGTMDTDEPALVALLLDMLEVAGRAPRPELIETCVEYRTWVTPGLLEILDEDVGRADEHWDADDPEQYRMNHAGLLLIHFRETEALPLLVEDFRQCTADTFNEWFEGKLRLYGPPALPALTDLVEDEDAGVWGRVEAAGELAHIGWAHEEARDRVLEVLRGVLPARDALPDEAGEDQMLLWANVARELGRLGDEESRPLVEAMFDHGLLDTMILPERAEYGRLLKGKGDTFIPFEPASYDVVEDYEHRHRQKQKQMRREALREKKQKQRAEQNRAEQAAEGGHYEGGTFVRDEPKVGRNDPCPCGSGAKYKYCCG